MAGDNSVKVEIKDVIKRFQTRNGVVTALNGVNLSIKDKEFVKFLNICLQNIFFWVYNLSIYLKGEGL